MFEKGFDWNLNKFPNLRKFKLGTVKWKPYDKSYITLFKVKKLKKKNNLHRLPLAPPQFCYRKTAYKRMLAEIVSNNWLKISGARTHMINLIMKNLIN